MIDFIVRGNPKALKRHYTHAIYKKDADGKARPVMKNGRVITVQHDPSAQDRKDFLAVCAANLPDDLLIGPLYMEVQAFFPRPKNHHVSGDETRELKATAPAFKESKPDLDNIEKFVADAFESEFFKNDSQIAVKFSFKKYSNKFPFVRIILMTVTEWIGEAGHDVKEYNKQRALAL